MPGLVKCDYVVPVGYNIWGTGPRVNDLYHKGKMRTGVMYVPGERMNGESIDGREWLT